MSNITHAWNLNITTARWQVRGFTLVELMLTLVVASILLAVGIPSFRSFVASQQVKNASFDITAALMLARSEAIKRDANVVITPISTSWNNGWAMTTAAVTGNLSQHQAFRTGVSITGPSSVTYGGDGRLTASVTSFVVSSSGTTKTATISIDLSGLPATQ
jgi:type IV fimbrial biogenesis protein FimT